MTAVAPVTLALAQHEAICAALGILVGLAPQCTPVAVAYFKATRMSPLERLGREPVAAIDLAVLESAVKVCYQLLRADRGTFAPLWGWTVLYDCIQPSIPIDTRRYGFHRHRRLGSHGAGWPCRRWCCCMA